MKGAAFLPILVAGTTPFVLIALILLGSTLGLVAWRPPVLWTDRFGAPNLSSSVYSAAADRSGFYVTGSLNGNGTYGVSFLRGYDAVGRISWTSLLQNVSEAFVGISTGSDGVYVVQDGPTNETLLKYDFNGSEIWSQQNAKGVFVGPVSATTDAVYVAGCSDHPITNQTFTVTNTCISFVREYDPRGGIVWTSEFSNSVSIQAMVAEPSGVYILAPQILVAYSLNGQELWSLSLGDPSHISPSSVAADSTGVYVSGTLSPLFQDIGFLTKYSFSRSVIWNDTFDSPDQGGVGPISIASDSSGVYLSMVSPRGNGFITKYDTNGNQLWSFQTPLMPGPLMTVPVPGGFYLAGGTQTRMGRQALVQAFGASPSLVFFNSNPPLSFVLLGALIVVAVASVFFLSRRYTRIMSKRPKSASPDRFRSPGGR